MTRLAPDAETRAIHAEAKAILFRIGYDPRGVQHWQEMGKAIDALCRIDGCVSLRNGQGLCVRHYKEHRRAVANEAFTINYRATRRAA